MPKEDELSNEMLSKTLPENRHYRALGLWFSKKIKAKIPLPPINKKNIVIFLIILLGIGLGIYLTLHQQNFKGKATNDATRIEFIDSSGNTISQTTSQAVSLKLTYVVPSPELNFQPSAPYYATFYYPWYGTPTKNGSWRHWQDNNHNPPNDWFSNFTPAYGLYSSNDDSVIYKQLQDMLRAKQTVAISSWWGQGSFEDIAFAHIITDIMNRHDTPYPNLRWAIYYEPESISTPSVSQIEDDLNYIKQNYANQPGYLKINNQPVIFVYTSLADNTTNLQDLLNRWNQARADTNFYVSLHNPWNLSNISNPPNAWHSYAPAIRFVDQISQGPTTDYSSFVSPGFYKNGESSPRLNRDTSAFSNAVSQMVASHAVWKLTETWNEWGEGTSVEPANEFGDSYIQILNQLLPNVDPGQPPSGLGVQRLSVIMPYCINPNDNGSDITVSWPAWFHAAILDVSHSVNPFDIDFRNKNVVGVNSTDLTNINQSVPYSFNPGETWAIRTCNGTPGNCTRSQVVTFTLPPGCAVTPSTTSPSSSSSPFPTSFRVANSEAELAGATEQNFDQNGKVIDWTLALGNGAKTVFAQFKVGGSWQNPISANITLAIPNCTSNITCSGACSAPANTCGTNNGKQTNCVYTQPSGCTQVAAPDQDCSLSNCSTGYSCSSSGSCVMPNCTSGITCSGACSAPVNTCGNSNGTESSCKYTSLDNGSGICTQVSAPDQVCGLNNCSAGYSCTSGTCLSTALSVNLTSNAQKITLGQSDSLTWSSSNTASCQATTSGPDTTLWNGTLQTSGSTTLTPTKIGTYTLTLVCVNSTNQNSQASQTITVTLPSCTKTITCSGACSAPINTCSSNNGTQGSCQYTTLDNGSSSCTPSSAPNQQCTISDCSSGYSCSSGQCLLPCNSNITCSGACSAPANTCDSNNGTQGNCTYTSISNNTTSSTCAPVTAPNQICTVSNCSNGYSCNANQCIQSVTTTNSSPNPSTLANSPIQSSAPAASPIALVGPSPSPIRSTKPVSGPTSQVTFQVPTPKPISNIPLPTPIPVTNPLPQPQRFIPQISFSQLPIIKQILEFFNGFNNLLNGQF